MQYDTLDEMWLAESCHVRLNGSHLGSRDGGCLEVLGRSMTLADPMQNVVTHPGRKFSPSYACAELLWYLSGKRDTLMMQAYAPQYARFTEPGGHAYGAYGHRWRFDPGFVNQSGSMPREMDSQLDVLIATLKAHPESRQGVVTMWNGGDLIHALAGDKKDLPCTLSMQFLVRDGRLHLIVTMRSNDLWLGLPYDVFCFTSVQRLIAEELGVRLGTYTHNVGSLHLYDRNIEKFDAALAMRYVPPVNQQRVVVPRTVSLKDAIEGATSLEARNRMNLTGVEGIELPDVKLGDLFVDAIICCALKYASTPTKLFNPLLEACLERQRKET